MPAGSICLVYHTMGRMKAVDFPFGDSLLGRRRTRQQGHGASFPFGLQRAPAGQQHAVGARTNESTRDRRSITTVVRRKRGRGTAAAAAVRTRALPSRPSRAAVNGRRHIFRERTMNRQNVRGPSAETNFTKTAAHHCFVEREVSKFSICPHEKRRIVQGYTD